MLRECDSDDCDYETVDADNRPLSCPRWVHTEACLNAQKTAVVTTEAEDWLTYKHVRY